MTAICLSRDALSIRGPACEANPNTECRPAPELEAPDAYCREPSPALEHPLAPILPRHSIFAPQAPGQGGGYCEMPTAVQHAMAATRLHQEGDLEGALHFWNEALEADPSRYEFYWGRGATLGSLGWKEEASNDFYAANTLEPDAPVPLLLLGLTELTLGNQLTAAFFLNDYEERFPGNPDVVLALGVLEMMRQDYAQALSRFETALRADPGVNQGELYHGAALVFLERYEESLGPLGRALEAHPEDGQAYYYRGVALANLGRFGEAVEDFTQAVRLDPDNEAAWRFLTQAREDAGR